jgi:SnoaL-like domain
MNAPRSYDPQFRIELWSAPRATPRQMEGNAVEERISHTIQISLSESGDSRPLIPRIAGILTQLCGAGCVLIGTVALALMTDQLQGGYLALVLGWISAGILALLCGGLAGRPSSMNLVISAALDASFAGVMFAAAPQLPHWLTMLTAADAAIAASAVTVFAATAALTTVLCLFATPPALRYARVSEAFLRPRQPEIGDSPASSDSGELVVSAEAPSLPVPVGAALHRPSGENSRAARRIPRVLWIGCAGATIGLLAGIAVLTASRGSPLPGRQLNGGSPAMIPGSLQSAGDQQGARDIFAAATAPSAIKTVAPGSELVLTGATNQGPASPTALLDAIHDAIAHSDAITLKMLMVPGAFGFGIGSMGISTGSSEVAARLVADLGPVPDRGFVVTPSEVEIGDEGNHAWIAEELEITAGANSRRFAITMLATMIGKRWSMVAWHWAIRLPDQEIESLVAAGDLAIPEGFEDRINAPADAVEAFRSALSSTAGFAMAVSGRESAFNFGSAPGERLRGGATIRRVFKKLRADLAIREGIIVTAAGAWDPSQTTAPTVAWGAANIEFSTRKHRRILRVLAVMVREHHEWRVVQSQWSDGG